jgi:chaperonin GroES
MKIEPFGERLIVKRLSELERSGLVIPKEASLVKGSLVGLVIHCGPDAYFVAEGDIILFAKYSGTELPVDGKYLTGDYEDCLCMNEENILGKLREETIKEVANV